MEALITAAKQLVLRVAEEDLEPLRMSVREALWVCAALESGEPLQVSAGSGFDMNQAIDCLGRLQDAIDAAHDVARERGILPP